MVKETLQITNFGGLRDVVLDINPKFTLLLGPQASGKSIIAKLLYFFKGIIALRNVQLVKSKNVSLEDLMVRRFTQLFPSSNWPIEGFTIIYSQNERQFIIKKDKSRLLSIIPQELKEVFSEYLDDYERIKDNYINKGPESEKSMAEFLASFSARNKYITNASRKGFKIGDQLFVVAGRSFYSELNDNMLSLSANNVHIEQFLLESSGTISNAKRYYNLNGGGRDNRFKETMHEILMADYKRVNDKDYLTHNDGRQVELQFASSGQLETLPLLLVLDYVLNLVSMRSRSSGITLYIEEPEAHIFPSAQKAIVDLVAYISNVAKSNLQIVLTTHSPYVMTSFNNLIEADNLIREDKEKAQAVYSIIGEKTIVRFEDISSYFLSNGSIRSIMDYEERLIGASDLDAVSEVINVEFGKLMSLL